MPSRIPVCEAFDKESMVCARCGCAIHFEDLGYYVEASEGAKAKLLAALEDQEGLPEALGSVTCEPCGEALEVVITAIAERFAVDFCEVTGDPVSEFHESFRFAPTPDEYACGVRAAYTENALRASNRHQHTNYDALIGDLDRDAFADQILYRAIRERVGELLPEIETFHEVESLQGDSESGDGKALD